MILIGAFGILTYSGNHIALVVGYVLGIGAGGRHRPLRRRLRQ